MTLVRIIKNWDWPDLMRQTQGKQGIWDDIQFTVDPVEECDFVVMLNNNMKSEEHCQMSKGKYLGAYAGTLC